QQPGEVRLWDVKTGQARATLQGHTRPVTSVAFSPDGLTLASASGGVDAQLKPLPGEVRLWDVKTGQAKATLQGPSKYVDSVAFSPDGQLVFGWDVDGNVRAWAVKDGQPTETVQPPPPPSDTAVTIPDGTLRAKARNNVVVLLDLKGFDA